MPIWEFNHIFFWVFVLTNIVFAALFVWKTYQSYRAANAGKSVVIKAIVSLVIWLISTVVIIAASAAYFYADTPDATDRAVQLESATVYFLSFIIGWILIGAWIIYWISRPTKRKDYGKYKS